MVQAQQFTAAEAAFVLREPIRTVKKALDSGPVRPKLLRKAGTSVRAIGWCDLVYLYVARNLREELTPKARAEFYEALRRAPIKRGREISFGRLRVGIGDLIEEVEHRTAKLAELSESVEFRTDGEPIIKGSDIEVYRIAALLAGGMSIGDVQADYPSLSRKAIETAKAYADVHPKPGRPYPGITVKRALRGARLEALDGVLGDGDASE
jgi:uncharacterized protein (DUF433 family)